MEKSCFVPLLVPVLFPIIMPVIFNFDLFQFGTDEKKDHSIYAKDFTLSSMVDRLPPMFHATPSAGRVSIVLGSQLFQGKCQPLNKVIYGNPFESNCHRKSISIKYFNHVAK